MRFPKFLKKITPSPIYAACRWAYIRFIELSTPNTISPIPKARLKDFTFTGRFQFFHTAAIYLKSNEIDGVYLEFGCDQANTFRMALNTLGRSELISHFFAFDSFQGMPDASGIDKQSHWTKVDLSTSETAFREICKMDMHRITMVPGFYEQSLPEYSLPSDQSVAMAYVDCDFYSSTVSCLGFLEKHLRHGMILAFDDWDLYFADNKRGQRKAFAEFASRNAGRYHFEPFHRLLTGGNSFIVHEREKIGEVSE